MKREKKTCPTQEEFLDALARRSKAEAFREAPSRKREKKMLWCLKEAVHDWELKKFKEAQCISWSQDLQGNKMSLRYCVVFGSSLEKSHGLIGFKTTRLGAIEEVITTKRLMKSFMIKRANPPDGWTGPKNLLSIKDLEAVKSKVDAWLLRDLSLVFINNQ